MYNALRSHPYRKGDVHLLRDIREVFTASEELHEKLEAIAGSQQAFVRTVTHEGEVVAVVGLVRSWTGVAELFSITSSAVLKNPISYHKLILRLIEQHVEVLELHRVQFVVKSNFDQGIRWAKSLGFTAEGLLRKYGQDKTDHWMFARVYG